MKLEEIRKVAEHKGVKAYVNFSHQKADANIFFKSLYAECIQILESIPADTIDSIFSKSRTIVGSTDCHREVVSLALSIQAGKADVFAHVDGFYEELAEELAAEEVAEEIVEDMAGATDIYEPVITIDSKFDARGIWMEIGISSGYEDMVKLKCDFKSDDTNYDFLRNLGNEKLIEELFGDYLKYDSSFIDDEFYDCTLYLDLEVNAKWFEN